MCQKIKTYFKKHSPLFSIKVARQDVPQPEDDTVTAVETSVVDGVFPEEEKKTDQYETLSNLTGGIIKGDSSIMLLT